MRIRSGNDWVRLRGGHWQNKNWGESRRSFLQATEQMLLAELDLWKVDDSPPWNRLRFVLTADQSADAFAHYAYGWHTIGVHAGLALRLWESIPRIASSSKWRAAIPTLSPPIFSSRLEETASTIARLGLRWVFAHEVAHSFRGHTLALAELGIQPTRYEAGQGVVAIDHELERFFELDADSVAADILVRIADDVIYSAHKKRERELGFAQIIFSIGLVLLLLDRDQVSLEEHTALPHPHPFVRLQLAIDFGAATAAEQLRITRKSAERCAASALKALGIAASVLGYKSTTWLLSSNEYARAIGYLNGDKSLLMSMTEKLFVGRASFGHKRWFQRQQ